MHDCRLQHDTSAAFSARPTHLEWKRKRTAGSTMFRRRAVRTIGLLLLIALPGCLDIQLPEFSLLGEGPIVLQGRMSSTADSCCPVWEADIGLRFVLFQDSRIPNAAFDSVTTPGTRSRLELDARGDVGEPCSDGAQNAEVVSILEVVEETDE